MNLIRCGHCGANLRPEDMMQPGCLYCGTILPHQARAAQQAELVTNLMADRNGNGIPDAFEGLVGGSMGHVVSYHSGMNASGPGQPMMTSHSNPGAGGAPFGFNGLIQAQAQMQQEMVKHTMRGVWIAVGVSVAVGLIITVAVIVSVLV